MERRQRALEKRFGGRITAETRGGYIRLTGTAESWDEAVEAGQIMARRGVHTHVVNDVRIPGFTPPQTTLPPIRDDAIDGVRCDVLVVGAGVVGCAIARELRRLDLSVLLIDKEYDVGLHASSRNDGMIHPGIDIPPFLLKKKLNNRGNRMYDRLCRELGVPFSRCGQYLCFHNRWMFFVMLPTLPFWYLTGVGRATPCTRRMLNRMEPDVAPDVACALRFHRTGVVCPYGLTIALAENAVENGARLSLDTAVTQMDVRDGLILSVTTNRGVVYPRLVVNAAGVFAEDVARMADDRFFSIHPRRGTNAILDKKAKRHVQTNYSLMGMQSKSGHTKGGGIVSTVDGNVLVGPDAHETPDKEDFSTDAESIRATFEKHHAVAPWLTAADIITYFTGVRAATYEEDFIVERGRRTKNIVHAAGIQSPGLTAAPAIAARVGRLVRRALPGTRKNPGFDPHRTPIVRTRELDAAARAALIAENADYGQIVCRCEEISRGEILDALRRPVPCETVDGVKRRVRPGMGRCQGAFCGQQIMHILSEALHIPLSQVRKGPYGSEILAGAKGADDGTV